MKLKHLFVFFLFIGAASFLKAQAVLSPEVLEKLNNAVFEVIVLKPAEGNLKYEKKLPMERIPFAIRNDKYFPIGTAFLMDDGLFYSAAHVFNLNEESLYGDYYIRSYTGDIYKVDTITSYSTNRDFISFTVSGYKYTEGMGLSVENKILLNTQTFSVGNALGEGIIIRHGLLTSQTFEQENGEWKWLRFSAAASPGNSGGPLITPEGGVLGIITMKSSNENLNYALPFSETKKIEPNTGITHISIYYVMPNIFEEKFFYEYNHKQKLPQKISDVKKNILSDYKTFTANIVKDIQTKFDFSGNESFAKSYGSQEIMYNSWLPSFPLTIVRESNKKWDLFIPNNINEYKLPQNGKISYGTLLNSLTVMIKKPDNITQKELISSPDLYMDYILQASRLYRPIGNERIPITSYGKPVRSQKHTDVHGRTWLVNFWELPFADAEVISYALPLPGGLYIMSKIDSTSETRNGHNLDLAFISDYVIPSYSGSFNDWKEYLALGDSGYSLDPVFSSMKFDFNKKETMIKTGDYDLHIPQQLFSSDKDTTLKAAIGFYLENNKLKFDVQGIQLSTNIRNDNYTYIGFSKILNPPEDAPQTMTDKWIQKIDKAAPFNAKPYNENQYTFYDEILFPDGIPVEEKNKLQYIYHLNLALKQQNRFEEIEKFAKEMKNLLKLPKAKIKK